MQIVREPRISRATEGLLFSLDQHCDTSDSLRDLVSWLPVAAPPDSSELTYSLSPKSKTGISMLQMVSRLNVLDGSLSLSSALLVIESRLSGVYPSLTTTIHETTSGHIRRQTRKSHSC